MLAFFVFVFQILPEKINLNIHIYIYLIQQIISAQSKYSKQYKIFCFKVRIFIK